MKEYYETRAPEYDEWYLGVGRFHDRVRPLFTPEQLAHELGGGEHFFAGQWFVVVRA